MVSGLIEDFARYNRERYLKVARADPALKSVLRVASKERWWTFLGESDGT